MAEEQNGLALVEEICNNYVVPIICGVGIVGNLLNLMVLGRKTLNDSPYCYLTGLAVSDLITLALTVIFSLVSQKYGIGNYDWRIFDAKVYYPLANVTTTASIWLTVALTIERFIFVKYPITSKRVCTKKTARHIIALVYFAALVINIPLWFCLDAQLVSKNETDVYILAPTEFEKSNLYYGITWISISVTQLIPILILASLNLCLVSSVWAIHKRKQQRFRSSVNQDPRANQDQIRLTITLISIVVLFLICFTPSIFLNKHIAHGLFGEGRTYTDFYYSKPYRLCKLISNMLVTCNLALNFVFYCVFNRRFVRAMTEMFTEWATFTSQCCLSKAISNYCPCCLHYNQQNDHTAIATCDMDTKWIKEPSRSRIANGNHSQIGSSKV
ncbi:unnamed protein product [Owenia fusiformis]|uniref:G-protein coupled receptors family 1 profile domain-containing protein n=1 Tax=Owenia fusiformis TaxID=6347 RepID=A0A8S4N093_OWEFU|nr:unnamed protein product [Owenia fusiformis]